jgi:signal transduction histidine kinase
VALDADLLKETVLTLVQNAKEAMPAGGTLTISLHDVEIDTLRGKQLGLKQGVFVVLSAADTGAGMDDKAQRHVFEPFFTTKGMANAEGLGLASAYGFVQQSGGTITVRSAPNQGSMFELYLPTAEAIKEQIAA